MREATFLMSMTSSITVNLYMYVVLKIFSTVHIHCLVTATTTLSGRVVSADLISGKREERKQV